MAETPNTYDSNTNLSLGHIPQVDDPDLYVALLDLHNAIETLLKSSDAGTSINDDFIRKQRNVTEVNTDYTVQLTDGLILVDTTAGDITITMHTVALGIGYRYDIKQIIGTNQTLIVGDSGDLIDSDASGLTIDLLEAVPLKNDGTEWWIHN